MRPPPLQQLVLDLQPPLLPGGVVPEQSRLVGHGGDLHGHIIIVLPRPLLPFLAPGLLHVPHLRLEGSGGLIFVVHDEAVRQVEEVPGVSLDDAAHLLGAEGRDGAAGLALAPVLPPSAQGGEAELDGVLVGVGAEPRG